MNCPKCHSRDVRFYKVTASSHVEKSGLNGKKCLIPKILLRFACLGCGHGFSLNEGIMQ